MEDGMSTTAIMQKTPAQAIAGAGDKAVTRSPRKAALASWIGSAVEYYDFFIYGTAAALVFGKIFFPSFDPAAATVAAFATFGVGYVTRIENHRVAFQVNVDNLANRRYWNSVQTGTYGIGMDRSIKFNMRVDL